MHYTIYLKTNKKIDYDDLVILDVHMEKISIFSIDNKKYYITHKGSIFAPRVCAERMCEYFGVRFEDHIFERKND